MALTFEYTMVKDWETVCIIEDEAGKRLNPVTDALVWKTMSVGIGQITEANAAEFYARVHLVEQLDGPSLRRVNEDGEWALIGITPEDVRQHIGLQTNATYRTEPRGKWLTRIVGLGLDDSKRHYQRMCDLVDIGTTPEAT